MTLAGSALLAGPAAADFGFDGGVRAEYHQPRDIGLLDTFTEEGGPPLVAETQAGAHSDLTVDFLLNQKPTPPGGNSPVPDETLRDVVADLPTGFYGNPQSRPACAAAEFAANTGFCNENAQVGVVAVQIGTDPAQGAFYKSNVPVYNMQTSKDETAVLAFAVAGVPVKMTVTPRSEGDYGLQATMRGLPQTVLIYGAKLTLWGDPSDPIHDRLRPRYENSNPDYNYDPDTDQLRGYPSTAPRLPFLSTPARCDGPLPVELRIRSWEQPTRTVTGSTAISARTGCEQLSFDADVDVQPTERAAGQPTGVDVDLRVPQTDAIDQLATPQVKDVTVRFPDGMAISPAAAHGLQACSDEQLATDTRKTEACPDAAKIGTARITTPLLGTPLEGSVYLGTQKSLDPASGEMYRVFITAYGKGVRVKLKGSIKADPKTGRLTAAFAQNPQLPFDTLQLEMDGGSRAVLVNPTTCGPKTSSATVSSYAGTEAASESTFTIDQGCPSGQFAPAFTAGTMDPVAGGLSPFVMTTTRTDADQDLSKIRLDLPSGLLGALGSVPVCADAQASVGTCDASTRLGSTRVAVGTGSTPYSLPGTVSLAGPYKGAPFSLSIAVPAKAGPLDLGMVVVRSPLIIDANKAKVTAPVDDLPQIVGGVPMHYRSISVALDRPGFMFNATSCSPQTVVGTLTSSNGVEQRPGVRYQAQGCDKLKLAPSLKLAYSGKADLKKGKNPKFTADLGQTFGQAGLKRVRVSLPLTSTLKAENANALCTPEQAAARNCPAASIVGRASATTPALHEPLTGPVYFLQGTKRTASGKIAKTLPKLWLRLRGDGVDLDLRADSATNNKTKQLMATFVDIPDAPIANFKLEIDGGPKGILGAPPDRDPCTASRRATVQFDGQNGGRQIRSLNIAAPECGVRASMNATASQVRVGFTGIAAGKVSVSGKGLKSTSRTVKSGDRATLVASLDAATRRQIASGRTVKLRLTATFDPKATGKTTRITKTVTIKGAKKRR
jgi:hypothetical protein